MCMKVRGLSKGAKKPREHHTVSALLNRMEGEGLVRKTKGHQRKNMIKVELTNKGEKAYRLSRKLVSITNIFSSLTDQDKNRLKKYLQSLRNNALVQVQQNSPKDAFPYP